MPVTVTTADFAAALIAVLEGEKLEAYQDSGGVWTIGIGHTKGVQQGMTISHEQAVQLFAEDSGHLLSMTADYPLIKAAPLVSFGFNCGASTLARVIAGTDAISNPVHMTDRHGDVLRGLRARRRLEGMLVAISDQMAVKP